MLIKPIQRYIKRQVEREICDVALAQAGLDPLKAQPRLHWGAPKTQEASLADMLKAAELGLIRAEEFRKNAVKFGWELWDAISAEAEWVMTEVAYGRYEEAYRADSQRIKWTYGASAGQAGYKVGVYMER